MKAFLTRCCAAVTVIVLSACVTDFPREKAGVGQLPKLARELPSTYSIVARDLENGDLGVAVQSKFFGVGAVVPWVRAGVGAIATQSYANTSYGPRGLEAMAGGRSAVQTLRWLLASDGQRESRQVGMVDARGGVATFTGAGCHPWAGGRLGKDYTVQGNILVGRQTVLAMADAFEASEGEPLAERLMRALEAGQKAGGDVRGKQSAAIRVARAGAGYGGNDRYVWLDVEDHPRPVKELRRLLDRRFGRDPLSRARRALRSGKIGEARELLEQAEANDPDNAQVLLDRAALELAAIGSNGGANDKKAERRAFEEALGRVVGIDPDYDNIWYQVAVLQARAGAVNRAVASLRKLLEINPHYRWRIELDVETPPHPFADDANAAAIRGAGLLGARSTGGD